MNKKFFKNFGGKGYYIALILCAAAIGISGYLYYRDTEPKKQAVQQAPSDTNDDIQAAITDPTTTEPTDPSEPSTPIPLQTMAPLAGNTIGEYAMDCLSYNPTTRDWRTHDGIDIAADAGTAVCAAADGTVYTVYDDDTMGMTVVIRHEDGYVSSYACLAEDVAVAPGDTVTMGQAIGAVGQTALMESAIGHHLHFSVTLNDESISPAEFLSIGK